MMRTWLKQALAPLLYRHPVPELPPVRLYLYLDAIWRTRALPGAVVEVGCFQCGTSANAFRMTQAIGLNRRHVCIDTFGGFVGGQFARDVELGTAPAHEKGFQANSLALVTTLLELWNVAGIELVQADVAAMSSDRLPEQIAVALIDVDLEAPTYAALEKVYPRLVPGGVILVDDCSAEASNVFRGARVGYQRFAAERHCPERYVFGMGWIGDAPPGSPAD